MEAEGSKERIVHRNIRIHKEASEIKSRYSLQMGIWQHLHETWLKPQARLAQLITTGEKNRQAKDKANGSVLCGPHQDAAWCVRDNLPLISLYGRQEYGDEKKEGRALPNRT